MKHHFRILYVLALIAVIQQRVNAQRIEPLQSARILSQDELTQTAYCSDGSDRARGGNPRFSGAMEARGITYRNYQYVSYYESTGEVIIARRNVTKPGSWEKSVLQDHKMVLDDRHRKIAIGISNGDGVIHLSFDHHNNPVFNYARTAVGVADHPEDVTWDNSVFKYTPNLGMKEATGLVTYPSFLPLNGTGNMIIYWRTGGAVGGEMNLAHYDSKIHTWSLIGQISSRYGHYKGKYGERGPYHAGFKSDSQGTIHISWLWREEEKLRDNNAIRYGNHGLYYAYSKDGGFSWFDTNGKLIADTRKGDKISIDNIGGTVMEIPMTTEPSNGQISSTIDPVTDKLHVLSAHYIENTKTEKTFEYVRDDKGKWSEQKTGLPTSGSLLFTKDYAFAFCGSKIFFSARADSFSKWQEIKIEQKFPNGENNWDMSRIDEGIVSLIIQLNPKTLGEPSPVRVYDLKIADID